MSRYQPSGISLRGLRGLRAGKLPGASDGLAEVAEQIQYDLGQGPGPQATRELHTFTALARALRYAGEVTRASPREG